MCSDLGKPSIQPLAEPATQNVTTASLFVALLHRCARSGPAKVAQKCESRWPSPAGFDLTGSPPHGHLVDKAGSVTLRHNSRLHHIGIGRTHAGTCVILLVQDLQIRVVNAATGELLRDLVLDPNRDYQPTRAPKGPTRRPPK